MRLVLYSSWASLVPWMVFAIGDRNGGIGAETSALVAAGAAVALYFSAVHLRLRRPILFSAVAIFGALSIILWLQGQHFLGGDSRALVVGALAAVLATSASVRPVTLHHLQPRVAPSRAATPDFIRVNRRLTLCWSACAAVSATSFLMGAHYRHPGPVTICNWLVPILAIFVAGLATSRTITEEQSRLEGISTRVAVGLLEMGPVGLSPASRRHLTVVDDPDA